MFDIAKFKIFAKKQLEKRWAVPIAITTITIILSFIFSLPNSFPLNQEFINIIANGDMNSISTYLENSLSSASTLLTFILGIIQLLVSFIITAASTGVYLKMSRSPEPISFKDFVDGFANWSRGILIGLWLLLWLYIWAFLAAVIISIVVVVPTFFLVDSVPVLSSILNIIVFGIIIFIFTNRRLSYSMIYYIAIEFPKVSVPKAMNISKLITKGNLMNLFLLELSFISWIFLTVITFGIASLWYEPYYNMTLTNAYHGLLKNAVEKGLIKQEDLI